MNDETERFEEVEKFLEWWPETDGLDRDVIEVASNTPYDTATAYLRRSDLVDLLDEARQGRTDRVAAFTYRSEIDRLKPLAFDECGNPWRGLAQDMARTAGRKADDLRMQNDRLIAVVNLADRLATAVDGPETYDEVLRIANELRGWIAEWRASR